MTYSSSKILSWFRSSGTATANVTNILRPHQFVVGHCQHKEKIPLLVGVPSKKPVLLLSVTPDSKLERPYKQYRIGIRQRRLLCIIDNYGIILVIPR